MLMKLTRTDKLDPFSNHIWINTDFVRTITTIKKPGEDRMITRIILGDGRDSFYDIRETPEYIADFSPGNATRPKGSLP